MIRRRPQSNGSSLDRKSSEYKKSDKYKTNNPVVKISVWVPTSILALLLMAIADYLHSINSYGHHYEPNTMHPPTHPTNRTEPNAIHLPTNRTHDAATPDSNIEIPYIRYDPDFHAIMDRMDYAIKNRDENSPNNTCGQHLLDFGIIGFPKCGTTTMMRWLNMHDDIAVLPRENMSLQKQHPARVIKFITSGIPEGRYRRGFKSPNDVENGRSRNKLRIHYPKTKLLVGLRHPVLWFESFYNHRIQNSFKMPDKEQIEHPKQSFKTCAGIWQGACLPRANFHWALVKWGKTPLLSLDKKGYDSYYGDNYQKDKEWELFSKKEIKNIKKEIETSFISPNPIFLYEVSQLRMHDDETKSEKDYEDFVLSLQGFMGVSKNVSAMPTMIKESPGKKGLDNNQQQARLDGLKIDICDERFITARKMLIDIGANVAEWIITYFAKSPHGVTLGGGVNDDGSSRLLEILESYKNDPCPERLETREAVLTKTAKVRNSEVRNVTKTEPKLQKVPRKRQKVTPMWQPKFDGP